MTGLRASFAALIGDRSASTTRERYAKIGAVPMPTSLLLGGGEHGGLRLSDEYLQVCGYVGVAAGWSTRSKRSYIRVIRPADLDAEYADDDPSLAVIVREERRRKVDGVSRNVVDVWDISNPKNPRMSVHLCGPEGNAMDDVTDRVDDLDPEDLSGDTYWWRYSDGRAFIPIAIYGCIGSAMQQIHLTEGCLGAGVYRTCLAGVMLDSGFPERNTRGMKRGDDAVAGSSGKGIMRGDVRVWTDLNDGSVPEHWEWGPGDDAEKLFRVIHAYEADLISQLGVPVELSATGGEPLAHEIDEQAYAVERWFDPCRGGDCELLSILSAIRNRAIPGDPEPETGHGILYRREIDQAIEPPDQAETPNTNTNEEE